MEAVEEELKEAKELSVYNYDEICAFFEAYELNKRTAEKKNPSIDTDNKYLIRYAFGNKDFIQFILKEFLPDRVKGEDEEIDIFNEFGLKMHICLPEEDPKMFRLGWKIAVDILALYSAASFKFIKRGKMMSSVEGQAGKDITVYIDADNRNVKDREDKRGWEFIMGEINKALICANVPPGKRPPGTLVKPEKYIANCEYISYRYENGTPPHDPLTEIVLKSKHEITWEQNVVNLNELANSDNDQPNAFRCCCK